MYRDSNRKETNGDVVELLVRIEQHLAAIREHSERASCQWLTVDEVAAELQVSRDTVERLVAAGRLKASQIETPKGRGRRHRYRIHREWIDNFFHRNIKPSPPAERPQRRKRIGQDTIDFIG